MNVAASHEEHMSPLMILLLTAYEKMQVSMLELIKSSENIYLKACSASCSQSTECLLSYLHSKLLFRCCRSVTTMAGDLILVPILDKNLINQMSGNFEPEKYKDEYHIRLKKAIKRKISGNEIVQSTDENAFIRQKPFWRGALNDPNIKRQKLSDLSGLISKALKMNPASIHIACILVDG